MLCGLRWLGRGAGKPEEALAAVVLGNVTACVATISMALPVAGQDAGDWMLIGYLGVVQIAVAYMLVTYGLRRVPALDASLLLLVETALNPLWTWLLLAEVPSVTALAGGAVIIGATVLQTIVAARAPTVEPA
jgi:drug/metabolite transporter (DMT)-like permease